jgi:hypothetical protein
MSEEGPGPGRILLGAVLFLVFAGAAWYIVYLRAQNTQLRTQQPDAPIAPVDVPAAPAANVGAAARAPAGDRSLTPEQREAMLGKLRATFGSERPVWFATIAGNAEAAAFRLTLQTIFEEAGWEVRGNEQVNFQVKPGIFLMAGDEEPPDYIGDVGEAFEAAGVKITIGRGYRQFYEDKKRENPNWNGVGLAPTQSYVLVVGPKPTS